MQLNAQESYTTEMHWNVIYYRNPLEKIFSIRMHWKEFYYRNALESDLL